MKRKPGSDYPGLYLIGKANGVRGFFHSDDVAKNWVGINDDQHQWDWCCTSLARKPLFN
jgi:xyloglucan-specific exo-beta-1,4-glucanase